jgi:hypothetical protein
LLEDEHGNFHLKNLSMHPAESEEEALNLLFLGDANRAIAETPMNMVQRPYPYIHQFKNNDLIYDASRRPLPDLTASSLSLWKQS